MFDIEFRRQQLRKCVARNISIDGIEESLCLMVLEDLNYFGNWTPEEINKRPVDLEEVTEIVYEYLYEKGYGK